MTKPECKNSVYSDHLLSKKEYAKYKINMAFTEIPLKNWCDFNVLISKYQTSPDPTKSMAKYNISEEEIKDSERSLFSEDIWKQLIEKFKKKKLPLSPLTTSIEEKWSFISDLCTQHNSTRHAREYLNQIETASTLSNDHLKTLDLLREILHLVEANTFILDPTNKSKVSEKDFSYQIRLPLFKKLFHINSEVVRINISETVLSQSTESKVALYPNAKNIVGFKVDMRFIFDFEDEEFDIACAEACIPSSDDRKIHHDMSKLLREGKVMQNTIQTVVQDNDGVYSWILQLSGPTCSFKTVHSTKYQYHVAVPQFTVSFPSKYSQLASFGTSLNKLFTFRNSVENIANKINEAVLSTRESLTESELQSDLGSPEPSEVDAPYSPPLYHTPPCNEHSLSRLPEHDPAEEVSESDNDSSETNSIPDDEHDKFGFVECDQGWRNVITGAIFSSHPYMI